jgi:RNA polymerase sigma factor (sigma-70 family)
MPENDQSISFIWKSFLAGDKKAFAYLYDLHAGAMYRYGTKLCMDENMVMDAIQDIFLDLFMKRGKINTNPENLRFYLFLALKRNLVKKIKHSRNFVRKKDFEMNFEPEYSIEKTIIENEEEMEINHLIGDLLRKLPAKQKEALYLRFYEMMEYKEIAQMLEIEVESVRIQVFRALKTIREKIRK